MDDLFFGVKRTHLAVNRWATLRLRAFGMTPARFDLMRLIYERQYEAAQSYLHHRLGVARSTVSRMIRALEALGLLERKRDPWDGRTLRCALTYEGRRAVASVLSALVWPKVIANLVNDAIRLDAKVTDVVVERASAEWLFRRVVYAFALGRGALVLTLD